eukprot:s4612_g4.t1
MCASDSSRSFEEGEATKEFDALNREIIGANISKSDRKLETLVTRQRKSIEENDSKIKVIEETVQKLQAPLEDMDVPTKGSNKAPGVRKIQELEKKAKKLSGEKEQLTQATESVNGLLIKAQSEIHKLQTELAEDLKTQIANEQFKVGDLFDFNRDLMAKHEALEKDKEALDAKLAKGFQIHREVKEKLKERENFTATLVDLNAELEAKCKILKTFCNEQWLKIAHLTIALEHSSLKPRVMRSHRMFSNKGAFH